MNNNVNISIPTPCHEDWNKMTSSQQGAFCNLCAKEVIDFSSKSKNEVIQYLKTTQDSTCGRINSKYLTSPKNNLYRKFNWTGSLGFASAFFATLFLTTKKVIAQTTKLETKKISLELNKTESEKITIFGNITGEGEQGGIPFADIIITKNTKPFLKLKSDSIGRYSFDILIEKNAIYSIQFISKEYTLKKISNINISNLLEIKPNVHLEKKEQYKQTFHANDIFVTGGLRVGFALPDNDTLRSIKNVIRILKDTPNCIGPISISKEKRDIDIQIRQDIEKLKEENE